MYHRSFLATTTVVFLCSNVPLGEAASPSESQTMEILWQPLRACVYGGWFGVLIGGLEESPHEFKHNDHPRDLLPGFAVPAEGARSEDDNDIEWTLL